jgi:drug/metabolite transporter (DMT)-like permease
VPPSPPAAPFELAGELAALAVTLCWATGSLLFAGVSARIGAFATNVLRLSFAAVVYTAVLFIRTGRPSPLDASPEQVLLLALSGFVGLVAGDHCFFRSLVLVGPRQATLLGALAPLFTAAIGRVFLAERLAGQALVGMAITLLGIALVVLERTPEWPGVAKVRLGSALGVAAALCQAVGLTLSKGAMHGLDAFSTAAIRMSAAVIFAWAVAFATGRAAGIAVTLARPRTASFLAAGALVGPVGGMWLSLVAIQHTETAVAATLMALAPITILPLVWITHREPPTARAIFGTLVAVSGVVLLVTR